MEKLEKKVKQNAIRRKKICVDKQILQKVQGKVRYLNEFWIWNGEYYSSFTQITLFYYAAPISYY